MGQSTQTCGSCERPRFAFDSEADVSYWTDRLGVSPEDVREAMERVRAIMADSPRDAGR